MHHVAIEVRLYEFADPWMMQVRHTSVNAWAGVVGVLPVDFQFNPRLRWTPTQLFVNPAPSIKEARRRLPDLGPPPLNEEPGERVRSWLPPSDRSIGGSRLGSQRCFRGLESWR